MRATQRRNAARADLWLCCASGGEMSVFDKINGNMSIGARLGLMSGLFVASSAFVTALLVGRAVGDINFSNKEAEGTDYLTGVWGSMRTGASFDAAGAERFNASAAAQALQAAQTDGERVSAGLALITAVADGSNLTLDPELDSFYAMDAATVKIPALLSAALQLEQAVADVSADPIEHNLRVSVAADRVTEAANAAKGSLEAAMANGAQSSALNAPAQALVQAASDLASASRAAAPGQRVTASADALEATTDAAWRATAEELSRLLDVRVANKQSELTFQLLLVALFLAAAGALAWVVSTGMGRRFKDLTATMDRLRTGDFKVHVPHTGDRHETGKIAETLEFLRDDMSKRVEEDARRLEEAQLGSEGILNAISRAQAVIEFKPDGTIMTANENFLGAMGYSLNEIVGQHHSMFATPEYARSPEYRSFWDRLNRGEFIADKFMRLAKGGKEIWIQASYNPIPDKAGKVVKVVKFAIDITEQEMLAKEALAKSAAFATSASAMMMVDRDFKVTYVNESTVALMRKHAEAFRKLWPTFNPDAMVGTCIDMFHKNPAHQRQMLSDPSRLPHRTDITIGDLKIQLNVSGIFDADRKYVGNVLEWADVTETRMNAGMLAALGRAQAIIEFNLDGSIVQANENFCQVMGYTANEIIGKHHSMFAPPDYARSGEYKAFWDKLNRGEFEAGKFRRLGKGGREVWIEATYNPILDGNGKPFKVVKFATDVTQIEHDRQAAEAERAARAEEQARVVRGLAAGLHELAEGDLTARIDEPFPGEYEKLRADFNAAMEKMQEAMKSIVSNAGGIRTGAGEISQAADDLSRRTEQQAASLEETAAALDEITATVRKTAEGAKQANSAVTVARGDAEASGQVVKETVAAMAEIEKSSNQISQIIGVIDEIAFQTNLLALNAGVEAARAGEAGRGFAVVASEVRALAQRSSEAAKEIKGLILASSQHVETGVDLVGQAGTALEQIVSKVTEISGLISEIAASAQEQATGLAQVNTAINQMDQTTQQNAAMVEESTAASHSLTQEAEELMTLISRFNTGDAVQVGARHAPPRPSGVPVQAQKRRVAQFAASQGSAALKSDDSDWEEF
ncbi:MAG: PAS domain S-box protein [Alphaproteobacteria bacterium]|nr:PAS domain S-box protein [Alphaproteobacteria bacterium]